MTIAVVEKQLSRPYEVGDNASATLRYSVTGTASSTLAEAAMVAFSPSKFQGLVRRSAKTDPVFVDTTNEPACIWDGTVIYGLWKRDDTGDSTYEFDTSGGTEHMTQSIETVGSYARTGETAGDHKGAIGWTKHGVEGIDHIVGAYAWAERHYLAEAYITARWRKRVANLTGCINNTTFRSFPAGEVMFVGAQGSYRQGNDDWEISFWFRQSKSRRNLEVGDITGIDKKGWEYLWVQYDDDGDDIKIPLAAYVEQVQYYGDFSVLGI